MQTPFRPLQPTARRSLNEAPMALRAPSGVWRFDGDRLTLLEASDSGPAMVLVPSEDVAMLAVDLPLPSRQKRMQALPFAIEDMIAEPLEAVHVALGAELAPGRFLAGAVRHERMREWVSQLAEAGLERASLVPDALALPVPAGGGWSIELARGRAMVRAADGTGFAMPAALLHGAWRAAGQPACISYGEPLPGAFGETIAILDASPVAARLPTPALDLRQGVYARPRAAIPQIWKRIAIAATAGALAHGAIAAADTLALAHIASEHEARTRSAIAMAAPNLVVGDDLTASAADLLPASGAAAPGSFLPLLIRTSAALRTLPAGVTLKALRFDATEGTLTIDVEAADITTLQRVGAALTAAGLGAEAGTSSVEQGKASGTFTVRST